MIVPQFGGEAAKADARWGASSGSTFEACLIFVVGKLLHCHVLLAAPKQPQQPRGGCTLNIKACCTPVWHLEVLLKKR